MVIHVNSADQFTNRSLLCKSIRADVSGFQSLEQCLARAAGVFDRDIHRQQRAGTTAQPVAFDDFFARVIDQCVSVDKDVLNLRMLIQLRVRHSRTQSNRAVNPVANPFDMVADDLVPFSDNANTAGMPVAVTQDQVFANDAVIDFIDVSLVPIRSVSKPLPFPCGRLRK